MFLIGTILSVAGGIKTIADAYKRVSTLVKGDPTEMVIGELRRLNQTVERLTDDIFYAPRLQGPGSPLRESKRVLQ